MEEQDQHKGKKKDVGRLKFEEYERLMKMGKYKEALAVCIEAADIYNNADAQFTIARNYDFGLLTLPRNRTKCLEYYKKSANQSLPIAMYSLGAVLGAHGEGREWVQKALETGDDYVAGRCYFHGYFKAQDRDQGLRLMLKSGHPRGLFVVAQNDSSLYEMEKVAKLGLQDAQLSFARELMLYKVTLASSRFGVFF